jgi:predicted membrane GTPase involved in stress response
VEATPKNIRLRKRILDSSARQREKKKLVQELEAV